MPKFQNGATERRYAEGMDRPYDMDEKLLCAISNRQDQKDVLDRLADILTEGIVKQFPEKF
ncbi:hypothetical protein AZE31_13675 [Paenibacillus polymyxa]|nr:hypothetical protein AZE31_13675 [Paenibacillus polymyxa]